MPISRAARATTGAAPLPVPPPMPAVTKAMCAPERWSRNSSMHSSAACAPIAGCAPAPKPCVTCTPIWTTRSALDACSAWLSVFATTNSTPSKPPEIMLLTALPPPPPTPNTVMRGFSSVISGRCRLMVIWLSFGSAPPRSWLGPTRIELLMDPGGIRATLLLELGYSNSGTQIVFSHAPHLARGPAFATALDGWAAIAGAAANSSSATCG